MHCSALRVFASLALLVACVGCGPAYMRRAEPDELYSSNGVGVPPADKSLVVFHRPGGAAGTYAVFNGTAVAGFLKRNQRFELLCEPGEQVFVGYLTREKWEQPVVIHAELAPGKTYDCEVDVGFIKSNTTFEPLKAGDDRCEDVAEWEEDDETAMIRNEACQEWDAYALERAEKNAKIIEEHVRGELRDELYLLERGDHR
jgi:hypothetical protein